jgi:hypothetical protein
MRVTLFFILAALVVSCLSEDGVSPGTATTFIRFFNGGNNDESRDLALAPDGGFMILATTRIQKAESDTAKTKIKLIKTDVSGNPIWQRLYPGFSIKNRNYDAAAIKPTPDGGYIISGSVIDLLGESKTFVLKVDDQGVPIDSTDLQFAPSVNEAGGGIALNAAGNYLVVSSQGNSTMIITEIDKTTFTVVSTVGHSSGQTEIIPRLIVDSQDLAVWSGVVTKSGLTGIRLLKTVPASINTEFDILLSDQGASEVGTGICQFGQVYALTGSSNRKADGSTGDTDILFKRVNPATGEVYASVTYVIEGQNDEGNSINATQDGGLIILASASSVGIGGRGDSDFFLIKMDAFGTFIWTSAFGSRFKDEGVVAMQASDGGYIILGTTTQGSIKIVTLVKTDELGLID